MTLTNLLRAAFATKPRPKTTRQLGIEALESRWCPAGGQLDTTFNGTGSRALPAATMQEAYESVVQLDGKIVSVGYSFSGTTPRVTVVRMNTNGSLDTTFNGTGKLLLPQTVAGVTFSNSASAALQPDGKILVGFSGVKKSSTGRTTNYDPYFAVARLNANGSVDTTFGTNAGYWLFNPQPGNNSTESHVSNLALLPGGGIVGSSLAKASDGKQGFAVFKLTASGQTDTAFGTGGLTVVHVGTVDNSSSHKMTVTPAGGVILASGAVPAGATSNQGCLVAFTPTGQLDTSFDGDGIAFSGLNTTRFNGVDMQGSNIIVGGHLTTGTSSRWMVSRYTLAGQLDTTFGTGGYFINDTSPSINGTSPLVRVASDGSIVIGANANYTDANGVKRYGFQVAHLLADGAADATFGSDGTGVVSVFDTVNYNHGLAIGPDNKIVCTGRLPSGSSTQVVITRFTAW
jgi:uncharacterized delta-60 repeat protein